MINLGDHFEAEWCSLIWKWYRAVDEAGIPVTERFQMLLKQQKYMLQHYNITPFSFYHPVAMSRQKPIAQFEGILINID